MGSVNVVYNQDISTLNVRDSVVIDVMTPTNGALVPAAVSAVAYCGTSTWGQLNAVQRGSSAAFVDRTFGPQSVGPYDLPTFANLALRLGVTDLRLNRIGDGTQSAGLLPIMGTVGALCTLVGICEGSLMNLTAVTLAYSAMTPANLRQLSGNSAEVFLDVAVLFPNGDTEVYQNVDGNLAATVGSVTTYSIDGATLGTAIVAAINNGIANSRARSSYFIAIPGVAAPGAPIVGVANTVTVPGTDGATFAIGSPVALAAAMLGSNAQKPYTGMYAFSGKCSGAALSLCGLTDVATAGNLMLTFAKAQNAHAIIAFPDGTAVDAARDQKNALGLTDWSISVMHGDFAEIVDNVNGAIHRLVDPSPIAGARYAITAVQESPANLAVPVIVGTTRVGAQQSQPYDDDEILELENVGINLFTNDTAGGVGFALAHNKNSLGKSAGYQGNIAYSRMLVFLIASYQSKFAGALVGLSQGFNGSPDKTRAAARALYNDFNDDLLRNDIIDGYVTICDLTNNGPGKGLLRVDNQVSQREIIDVVAVGLISGVGILSSVTTIRNPALGIGTP